MKINRLMTLQVIAGIIASLGITSCSNTSTKGVSTATGWKINDKKGGFQYNTNYGDQQAPLGMVAIEGGTFTMGRVQDDVMYDWNNNPTQQYVQSFYMDETEVTNVMYNEYLYWLKTVFPPSEENYRHIYEGALPDTMVWRNRLGFSESLTTSYLRHPAYANYPVVGVSWVQANDFAKWRTDRVNEATLEKAGYLKKNAKILEAYGDNHFSTETYLSAPDAMYGGNRDVVFQGVRNKAKDGKKNIYATQEFGLFTAEFRLPTEAEWEYAAVGLIGNREYNSYKGRKKYPWDGAHTRTGKRKVLGDQMANFKQGRGDYGGISGWSTDGADITNQVKSYPPNDFGLYDMAGNVAEWVADVYRPSITTDDNDFNYFRGNVYYKNKIGPDGKVEIVTSETIVYDTLPNGKVKARNLPGQIAQVLVDDSDTFLRQNFDSSDNRDYRDGASRGTAKGYNAPEHTLLADENGDIVRKYDTNKRTSLVNDQSRVYKGGSWKDRAYWLDPATRRFYAEDQATDYIGFRCAMTKVGAKPSKKRSKN